MNKFGVVYFFGVLVMFLSVLLVWGGYLVLASLIPLLGLLLLLVIVAISECY